MIFFFSSPQQVSSFSEFLMDVEGLLLCSVYKQLKRKWNGGLSSTDIYLGFVLTFFSVWITVKTRLLVPSRSKKCFLPKCQMIRSRRHAISLSLCLSSVIFLAPGCLPGLVQMNELTFAGGPCSRQHGVHPDKA